MYSHTVGREGRIFERGKEGGREGGREGVPIFVFWGAAVIHL